MRLVVLALGALGLAALASSAAARIPAATAGHDWTRFGWSVSRSNVFPFATGITAANAGSLKRRQVQLDGTADSSPIYLHGVTVNGRKRDVFFVTTTYGRTEAIDASSGAVLWRFTPPGYASWAGTPQITTASPVSDSSRRWIYGASPGGQIYKLAVANGRPAWSVSITKLPSREKIASPLNLVGGRVIATTGGYIGDAPPYQGHVAVINASNGKLLHVWNSLCSNRSGLIAPSTCAASDSAIWGRAGAVVDPTSGRIFVTTGNAPWDGKTNWGDSVLVLSRDATRLVGNYTPVNTDELNRTDADLGSTAPVLLGGGYVAQGGKDGKIRLLGLSRLLGTAPHKGGELQIVSTPPGVAAYTAPAVLHRGKETWMLTADYGGTAAFRLVNGRLSLAWHNATNGTSPVVAGGLLWVYSTSGGLAVYEPTTGRHITTLPSGKGHWSSPIVVDRRVALPEGDANDHATTGVLNIWTLP